MHIGEQTVRAFCDQVAAATPAPGGGAVAAVAGALGASLVAMVAGLTRGREKFRDVEAVMAAAQEAGLREAGALLELANEDQAAFNQVMAALALPKGTPEEKAARRQAVQEAYRAATRTPLETMEHCLEVMRHALAVVAQGNPSAATDACVGLLMASTGFEGALWNVAINLGSIADEAFRQETMEKVEKMRAEREEVLEAFRSLVPDPVERFLKKQ
ncbi:MAG: cyclodeaminase/cyclohydrolase family protein [Bacillota bacterium]